MGQRGEDCPAVTVPIRSAGRPGRIILIVGENISVNMFVMIHFTIFRLKTMITIMYHQLTTDLSHLVQLVFLIALSIFILVHQKQDEYG